MPHTGFPSGCSIRCAPARRRSAGIRSGLGLTALTVISRVIALHSAIGWSSVSVACQVPAAGTATSAIPGIRRPAVPLGRFGGNAAIGRDQRKRALDRLFGDDHDAQRRALPWRQRRGQHRNVGGLAATAGGSPGGRIRSRDGNRTSRQQQRRRSGGKPACEKHVIDHSGISPEPNSGPAGRVDWQDTELAGISQRI